MTSTITVGIPESPTVPTPAPAPGSFPPVAAAVKGARRQVGCAIAVDDSTDKKRAATTATMSASARAVP